MEIVHIKLGDQLSTKINEMAAKENTTAAEIGKNILTQYLFDDNYKIPFKMDVISGQIENLSLMIQKQSSKNGSQKDEKLFDKIALIESNFSALVTALDSMNQTRINEDSDLKKVSENNLDLLKCSFGFLLDSFVLMLFSLISFPVFLKFKLLA